jgi:hypothetical protein
MLEHLETGTSPAYQYIEALTHKRGIAIFSVLSSTACPP